VLNKKLQWKERKMDNPAPQKNKTGILGKALFFLKFLEIRLRFVAILLVTAHVVGYWDNVQNYVEHWQRNHSEVVREALKTQSEHKYFCPMHPFVMRNHPGNCPVCGMTLVERKKGAPAALPEGVLARVQVSHERVMQAGVRTEPVA
jgi:hypothetical protein